MSRRRRPTATLLFIGPETTFVVNPSLYPKLNYDPVKDFTPVSGLVTINHALILHPSVPVRSVKELIDLARSKPGALNYGTFGIGSSGHLNMEMLQTLAGAKLQAWHGKGETPALTDVMAGHIQLMFISVGTAVPQWRAGKVNFIAVGAGKRLAAASRGTHGGGERAPRLRGCVLVRPVRPGRNAGRGRRQDQRRGPAHLCRSGVPPDFSRPAILRFPSPARPSS